MKKVLLIDDDRNILTTLQIHLEDLGMEVIPADTGRKGLELFSQEKPRIVFLDLKLPDIDGLNVLDDIVRSGTKAYVIIITAYATINTAVKAIKMGAFDYLPKPFTPEQITHHLEMIAKVHGLESEVEILKDQLKGIVREGDFITRSRNIHKILKMARQVADADASILISGESGTGKGVLAGLIHAWSPRQPGPFITVDCAGLQENLLESDLFGHVKGAFTGAVRDKTGKLELTNGGTVFLDEVSEMSATIQAKLLHFLQHREFERLGDTQIIRVDVRVIAATNRDLEELVKEKLFRQDLFFRLNVIELFLPPLRERPEDIPLIAEHYLSKFASANNKQIQGITTKALEAIQSYPWPGNIRELINVIERGSILTTKDRLHPEDLPPHIANYTSAAQSSQKKQTMTEVEKSHIKDVLLHTASIEEAAQVLGIDPATLWRKRKKYQLD
ncbi:MAG: sigma-54-dependent Fis family transcriptional regulator [Desulfobacterales bacterium]|uniref:Sigma-54-dependent Fis family transcriptional regulator n=1 Tax=Candidatus Desulfatibia vada TaxID=2841696 RepID=A0A8J6TPU0_9BACT|nr:sigma-54-dependent Fis family transcriptional regulator [Candidatus Desulfatibia vada]MBL6970754.1 sigma-54-dependent Fis family transcriptional regulator [Desulfobacterales bacterium]